MHSKRFSLVVFVCVTVLIGIVVWRLRPVPPPMLHYVEVRTDHDGQIAVFRATNVSDQPFSYLAYDASTPWFYHRVPTASGGRPEAAYPCGMGAGHFELPPHTSRDLEIPIFGSLVPATVGIYFEQATPEEIDSRSQRPFAEFRSFIYHFLPTPEPTWSATSR